VSSSIGSTASHPLSARLHQLMPSPSKFYELVADLPRKPIEIRHQLHITLSARYRTYIIESATMGAGTLGQTGKGDRGRGELLYQGAFYDL
jgi:hypothetical protein